MSQATTVFVLSPRQKQILALWCQGVKYKAIGDMLHIKVNTVNQTLDQCMWKLRIERRADLHHYAVAHGYDRVNVEVSA